MSAGLANRKFDWIFFSAAGVAEFDIMQPNGIKYRRQH